MVIEYFAYGKTVSRQKGFAIALLMFGITVATVSDSQVSSNPLGLLVAAAAVLSSALYQVWAGSKQKELGVNGNQLLHQVSPSAVAMLAVLIPVLEPVGSLGKGDPKTILGFQYSQGAVMWILFSSCLGLVVTLRWVACGVWRHLGTRGGGRPSMAACACAELGVVRGAADATFTAVLCSSSCRPGGKMAA